MSRHIPSNDERDKAFIGVVEQWTDEILRFVGSGATRYCQILVKPVK